MELTDDERPDVASVLADLRQTPLQDVLALESVALKDALGRVSPESPVGQVPVAAFNSAI